MYKPLSPYCRDTTDKRDENRLYWLETKSMVLSVVRVAKWGARGKHFHVGALRLFEKMPALPNNPGLGKDWVPLRVSSVGCS